MYALARNARGPCGQGRWLNRPRCAPKLLGTVQRLVGHPQQRFGRVTVFRIAGHADRHGGRGQRASPVVHHQFRGGLADRIRTLERLCVVGVGQHQREFLAAETAGHVLAAARLREQRAKGAQQCIAGVVALGVVVALEVVEVEHQHR